MVRDWGICSICAAEVDVQGWGQELSGRLVERCQDAPPGELVLVSSGPDVRAPDPAVTGSRRLICQNLGFFRATEKLMLLIHKG